MESCQSNCNLRHAYQSQNWIVLRKRFVQYDNWSVCKHDVKESIHIHLGHWHQSLKLSNYPESFWWHISYLRSVHKLIWFRGVFLNENSAKYVSFFVHWWHGNVIKSYQDGSIATLSNHTKMGQLKPKVVWIWRKVLQSSCL